MSLPGCSTATIVLLSEWNARKPILTIPLRL
jgi:hypothetical protein